MDRRVDGFDTTFLVRFCGANCLLNGTAAFDKDLALFSIDAEDGAFFAFVVTGYDFDLVAFFDVCLDVTHESGKVGMGLENLWSEGYDLHELFFTKFTSDGSEDAGAARVVILIDDNDGVGIETEHRTIRTANGIRSAHHDGFDHATLFDGGSRDRITDVSGDDVTDASGAAAFAENSDHFCSAGAGIISNGELGFHLDHNFMG
jgi:hypothetical protein